MNKKKARGASLQNKKRFKQINNFEQNAEKLGINPEKLKEIQKAIWTENPLLKKLDRKSNG